MLKAGDKQKSFLPKGYSESPFSLEMRKGKRGSIMSVSDVIGVFEYSSNRVELTSRGGKLAVSGEGLVLSVFEERTVEIYGKITGIEIIYGKAGKE